MGAMGGCDCVGAIPDAPAVSRRLAGLVASGGVDPAASRAISASVAAGGVAVARLRRWRV